MQSVSIVGHRISKVGGPFVQNTRSVRQSTIQSTKRLSKVTILVRAESGETEKVQSGSSLLGGTPTPGSSLLGGAPPAPASVTEKPATGSSASGSSLLGGSPSGSSLLGGAPPSGLGSSASKAPKPGNVEDVELKSGVGCTSVWHICVFECTYACTHDSLLFLVF